VIWRGSILGGGNRSLRPLTCVLTPTAPAAAGAGTLRSLRDDFILRMLAASDSPRQITSAPVCLAPDSHVSGHDTAGSVAA